MRTASQSERSQTSVELAITKTDIIESDGPMLVVALLPVFSSNFVVDLKRQEVFSNLMTFPLPSGGSAIPSHSVDGLRRVTPHNGSLSFAHNGLLKLRQLIPTASPRRGDLERFYPTAIDLFLRSMVVGAASLFEAAGLSAPALLGVSLWTIRRYIAAYSDESVGAEFPSKAPHCFPILPLTTLGPSADTQLRQLCDLIHQTFGISGTPCFTADGRWQGVLPRV